MSAKNRCERKKYMGVWRWVSKLTTRMMSRFSMMVTRYMYTKRLKMTGCCARFSVSTKAKKS
jgi:hypothetical protein